MITSKDLTCRHCVYSVEYSYGHIECRQIPSFKLDRVCSQDFWCGQGLWIGQRSGFPNWEIARDAVIKVEEMDGDLKDPWGEQKVELPKHTTSQEIYAKDKRVIK